MNLLQRIFAGIGLGAIVLAPVTAIAQTAGSFSAPHKWTDTAAGKTYVYVPNRPVNLPVAGFTAPKAGTRIYIGNLACSDRHDQNCWIDCTQTQTDSSH